ncbi:hypothetical protein EYF80_049991 [Liparis tanakae]|uniref:Uncharacterized protein n=1 Tax=Liparis tanakae TaxID=230148 RepID=A0A4Z2FG33_9TELE|nr:hypothetical protein EYF80_049991 [Liparis tanakae]
MEKDLHWGQVDQVDQVGVLILPASVGLKAALLSPPGRTGSQGPFSGPPGGLPSRASREWVGWFTAAHVYSWSCWGRARGLKALFSMSQGFLMASCKHIARVGSVWQPVV